MMGLRAKVNSSLRLAWGAHAAQQAISFASMVVLARQLKPDDFGLMAMAWTFAGFAIVVADAGTIAALVSAPASNPMDLDEFFWGSVAWGACLAALLFTFAPLAGRIFSEARVEPLLRALSVAVLFTSISSLPRALAQRDLRFSRLGFVETAAPLAGAAVACGMAFNGFGAWSLVAQPISSSALGAAFLWLRTDYRPGKIKMTHRTHGPGDDGLNVSAFTVINFAGRNVDNLIIGAFLGSRELAMYGIAYRLMYVPIGSVAGIFSRVFTPLYTRIGADNDRQAKAFLEGIKGLSLLTFPMMTGLACLASPFVRIVFGAQWEDAALPIMILAPAGILQSLTHSAWSIYQSRHRTELMIRASLISLSLTAILLWAAHPFGIAGMALAYLIASTLAAGPQLLPALSILGIPPSALVAEIRPAASCSLAILASSMAMREILPAATSILMFGITVVIMAAAYSVCLRLCYPASFDHIRILLIPEASGRA